MLAPFSLVLVLSYSSPAGAVTRVSGNFTLEETFASGPGGDSNLLEGGLTLDIVPQTKKNLRSRFTLPLRFSVSDSGEDADANPVGNLAVDLGGEVYNLNLLYGRTATVSSTAELTDSTTSRAAVTLTFPDLPRIFASYSKTESSTGESTTQTDSFSLFGDYRYKWMNFRSGYNLSGRETNHAPAVTSTSLLFGAGGSYEPLPRTSVSLDYDFNRFTSKISGSGDTLTTTHSLRASADSRPLNWLGLGGNFTRNLTAFNEGESEQQFADVTATIHASQRLRFFGSLGVRSFDDLQDKREVTFTTLGTSFSDRLTEKVQVTASLSRSYESDPGQGENVRDNAGLNLIMDVTPRIALRTSLSMSRNENEEFVSAKRFDASGTLADRDALATDPSRTLQPGFIFFDIVNSDLFTLLTPFDPAASTAAVWSLPVHLVSEQFNVSKNIQLNMIPTDRTSMTISYTSSSSTADLDIARAGNQTVNGSLAWAANSRTSYSLSGTATIPESGESSYSATGSMSYRFLRRHQMSLSYSMQNSRSMVTDAFSGNLAFALRKRTSLDLVFASSQLFEEDQRYFVKVRFTKSF